MDILQRLGQNVRYLRKKKELSQEELGFESGIHRTYISDVERGTRNPSVTQLAKFAEALGVTPGKLLDADPKKRTGR